ncbi:MAG: glycoside hydrolase family 43 protein [Planctomycetaceae bacterium]|nr:glycoside hydrolase family 43 protein [Planctomycetaceae bacterium]
MQFQLRCGLITLFTIFLDVHPASGQTPEAGPLPTTHFVNPIAEGADPWVTRDPQSGKYLWCLSDGNRAIVIHRSVSLTTFGEKHVVWTAPETGPYSREVWAPELHFVEGRWVIYFAASDGQNKNHRAYALQSKTDDPLSEYALHGPFETGDSELENRWAIDMTLLEHRGRRYAIWSGWDTATSDRQYLYIAPMASPTVLSGRRVMLCDNADFPWEFTEDEGKGRGLNEGPEVLKSADRTFVTYSCGGSWLPTYKLGMLELVGDDPLNPASWKKFDQPVFQSTSKTYGVGHSCFVRSPDSKEFWHIFHAKMDRSGGWRRAVFVQPFRFSTDGFPEFGQPVTAGEPLMRPSGSEMPMLQLPYQSDLTTDHSYFGHHQFYEPLDGGLKLGTPPAEPVNVYRSGEKILLNALVPNDFTASININFNGNSESTDAGLLFRTTAPAVGFDAQRGYFVGLKPKENTVLLGKMDGRQWKELIRKPVSIDVSKEQRLSVTVVGDEISVKVNGIAVLSQTDSAYASGTVGLRVVNTTAVFSKFNLTKPMAVDRLSE